MSLREVKFSDVCTIEREIVSPSRIGRDEVYVGLEDIESNSGRILSYHSLDNLQLKSTKFKFSNKHILYGKLRPYLNKVALPDRDGVCSTDILPLLPKEGKTDRLFLAYLIRTAFFSRLATERSSGANLPRLSPQELEKFNISFPKFEEQQWIGQLLNRIESVLEKRRQTLRLADEFLKSAFLEMFSFYLYGQKQCDKQPIGKVTHFIDYRGKTPRKAESGTPLITAKNVKKGFISDEPREYILEDDYNSWMTRGFPKEGDVLFTTEAPLGNAAILGKLDKVVVGQRIITIQSGKTLKSEYLLYCLLSSVIQSEISKRSTGSTARGIRSKEFEKILIPIPSIDLQNKFADLVQKVERLKEKQKQSETQLQNLFNSLMQRAFKGELIGQRSIKAVGCR